MDGGTSIAFRPTIQADLDAAGCIAGSVCHGGTDAPMPLVSAPMTDGDWLDNYTQVSARAGTLTMSLLLDKANGAGGHVAPMDPTDPVLIRWKEWISVGAPYEVTEPGADAGTGTEPADAAPAADAAGDGALTWDRDVGPLLRARACTDCHGGAGGYSVETYGAALGFGSDGVPNVLPGDPTSVLAIYCEQGHYDLPYTDALTVIAWIVEWDARER